MRRVLALPLSTVERAGTGDLVSRTTADVDSLARTVRFAIPETLIAAVTSVLTVAAAVLVSPVAAIPCIVGLPAIVLGTRWYLRYAPAGYLWERAAYATMTGTVGETVDGGRTIDALGLSRGADPPDRRRSDGRLRGRAANALPAHDLVPDRRGRLRPARRRRARLGRLARLDRTGLDRRGDGRRALRPAARRPGRPADLLARRDPGRRDLVRAARRRLEGVRTTGRRPARSRPTSGCRRTTSATPTARATTSCTGSTSTSSRASESRSSGRRAPASRRSGACSRGSIRRGRAGSTSAASGSST